MGEANFYYFTCLKFFDKIKKKNKNAKSSGERKRKEGRQKGGSSAHRRPEEGREEASQPAFREEAQEFRHRSGYPTQARFDPLREMAQVRRAAETEGRPSPTSQGPASHQPIHHDLGQAHRHAGVQAVGQVPS